MTTLNKMGVVTIEFDRYARSFIDYAASCDGQVLEVGCAFGYVAREVLKRGGSLIANDLCYEHLNVLRANVTDVQRKRLTIMPGNFVDELELQANSMSGFYCARVFNWVNGPEMRQGLHNVFRWLKPGSKLFIAVGSPYINFFDVFLPEYEENKRQGVEWPGYITNIRSRVETVDEWVPDKLHLIDEEVLCREVERAGFVIEESSTYARPEIPLDAQLDGREGVGVIGYKPIE